MKIIYLIAPSEWKNIWWKYKKEKTTFSFPKPIFIAENAREIDLKCIWDRYKQWIELNKWVMKWPFLEAINRYSWVVYNNIDYENMTDSSKRFFEENVFILSGMYWMIKPLDHISNYKLPIETKWLYGFWWNKIALELDKLQPDYIVNLLPNSYAKLIWIWKCSKLKKIRNEYLLWKTKVININFFQKKDEKIVKISHWVKKYRWEFLKKICKNNLTNYNQFWWEIVNNWNFIDINIVK